MSAPLQIKLCGFTRPDDARLAVAEGADLIGLILWSPSPRAIDRVGARRVREQVPAGVPLVGVFVDEEPETIDELVAEIGLDRVQLHGAEPISEIVRHGDRAFRGVRDGDASAVPPGVPVVFDGPFSHTAARAELEAHWAAAHALSATHPVLLAGGLDPDNVADAIRAARPYGIDVSRGIESAPGIKDHDRLRRFVAAAREAERPSAAHSADKGRTRG
jgi:phosphoribosylanthranilate isomerase